MVGACNRAGIHEGVMECEGMLTCTYCGEEGQCRNTQVYTEQHAHVNVLNEHEGCNMSGFDLSCLKKCKIHFDLSGNKIVFIDTVVLLSATKSIY